jgi:hypothetical protein
MDERKATCINVASYEQALVYGEAYPILGIDDHPDRPTVKVRGSNGRVRWYPASCFDLSGATAVSISTVTIRDDLEASDSAAIEVELFLSTGEWRWCVFSTPEALYHYGDMLPSSDIRIHYGAHLIILTALSRETILQALDHLLIHGELLTHTLPLTPA